MNPYYLSPQQVESLRSLTIVEKKAACIYEAFRYTMANGYVTKRTYEGLHIKVYSALRKTHTGQTRCWLELSQNEKSSYIQLINLPQVSAAEILPCETKEQLESAAKQLTIIERNGPSPDEEIIAIRIDWGRGMHAIMTELRRQVEHLAPFYVRGAHGNEDIAHTAGKRSKAGELDPIFGWIAIVADFAMTKNQCETARRMRVSTKTVRDSGKRLRKKIMEWFEVGPPA